MAKLVQPYHSPGARNLDNRCARTACEADMGQNRYQHKHLRWLYCHACAIKINAACPESPPFELSNGQAAQTK